MLRFCKGDLGLESCSIVTNGSLVDARFLSEYGRYIDVLAVSCDSFDEATNVAIGRGAGDNVAQLFRIALMCREHGIKFKLNTVMCRLNVAEDMNEQVARLAPFRWKCFQVLMVRGENVSAQTLRDVRRFQIADEEYEGFCARHRGQPTFGAEPVRLLAKSYLFLDEYMRFLDRDGRLPSDPILEVGVEKALEQVFWDEAGFVERGGLYDWSRKGAQGCGTGEDNGLSW